MKRLLLLSFILASCYTSVKKPDYIFMNTIKQQAALNDSQKTIIELIPRKYDFGRRKTTQKLTGFFYLKNTGSLNFNPVSIQSNCDCIKTAYMAGPVSPGDSLKINYELTTSNRRGYLSNSIIAIGNCQFGNQTFCIDGTIITQ